jgi:hypothetical protein
MDEANQLENAIFTKFTAASIPFKHFVLWDILQERTICPPIVEKPDPTDYGVTRSLEDIKKLSASELTQFEMFRKLYVHKEEEYLRALELSRQFTLAEQTGLGILRSFFHEDIIREAQAVKTLPALWKLAKSYFPTSVQIDREREMFTVDYINFLAAEESSRMHPKELEAKMLTFQKKMEGSALEISPIRLHHDIFSILKRNKEYDALVQHVRTLKGANALTGKSVDDSGSPYRGEVTLTRSALIDLFLEAYDPERMNTGEVLAAYTGLSSSSLSKKSSIGSNKKTSTANKNAKNTTSTTNPPRVLPVLQSVITVPSLAIRHRVVRR